MHLRKIREFPPTLPLLLKNSLAPPKSEYLTDALEVAATPTPHQSNLRSGFAFIQTKPLIFHHSALAYLVFLAAISHRQG